MREPTDRTSRYGETGPSIITPLLAPPNGSDAEAIIATMKDLLTPTTIAAGAAPDGTTGAVDIVAVPKGVELKSLKALRDEYRTRPERKRGTAGVTDLDSLIELTNRHKRPESTMFAHRSRETPAITSVINYHEVDPISGEPRFGDHRVLYPLTLSDEWGKWMKADGQAMSQADFAAFIEDRVLDLAVVPEWAIPGTEVRPSTEAEENLAAAIRRLGGRVAGPDRIVELSRNLTISEKAEYRQQSNLDTGETVIVYASEHRDEGGDRFKVPNLFLIAIPVFQRGDLWLMAVRLRYRPVGGKVIWYVQITGAEHTLDHAFEEAARKAAQATGLPLYYGTPETKV